MKNNYACITKRRHSSRLLLTAIIVFINCFYAAAQTCSQVEILYQSPECLENKHQGSAGLGGTSCKEISVCVNQPYTYSSSVTGTGWTFNWTVTGPTAVVINPNNTSASVNITWLQVGVYTLTLTATDGSGNVFTYCLKVNVKDRPVANFTFTPNNVCAGSTIAFTNSTTYSGGGVGYSWNFGDPASGGSNFSTATNPVHIYNAVGVYTVTLIAYSLASSGGTGTGPDHPSIMACCADTFTLQVNIIPGSLIIECISTVCSGDTGTYTAVGCANPIWLPPVGGTFLSPPTGNTVTIIWGNGNPQGQILAQCPGGCIATVSVPIIPANPVIAGNAKPCFNSTTSYSLPVLPGTFYNWTLINISTATNYNSLLNTYPDNNTVWINWGMAPPGTYHLIINLINKHICCNSSGLLIINPTQAWEAFSDQTVCTGPPGASLFVLPAAGTYNWTVLAPNAGAAPLTGTGPTFNPIFSNTGNYTIEVIETGNNYCNSDSTNPQQIQVTVVGTPAPGIINGPDTICTGSDYSYSMSTNAPTGYHYEWTISAGTGSFQPGNLTSTTGNSSTILWTALPGTISVVLQRNGSPQCPKPVTLNVVKATVGSISGPLNVCVDGTGTYTLSGGNLPAGEVITWSLAFPFSSMGTIIAGQGTNSITVLWHGQPGMGPWGPVTINASTGCGNAIPLSGIMIHPKFTFSIIKSGIDICQGSGVNLAVTGAPPASTYLWNTSATTSGITNITTAGTYDVTVTKGGCSFNKQYLVPDPFEIAPVTCGVGICDANDSTNQLLGVTIIKPLVGTFTYQWYTDTFPTGTLILGATTPNYMTPTHGKFYCVVTYGNCSKHVGFEVSKVCCPDVNLPKITSVVRNTCNSYTFTGTTPNPFGAPITWYWGDGTSDSGASGVPITHVYTLAGEYCVTFCVGPPSPNTTNCSGNCVATNVTVPIEAAFSYTLGCNGCLSVSNGSTVITSNPAFVTYFWDFGDGDTSVAQNPGLHCYALPGTYVVSLTLTYNDSVVTCTKTATHTINYSILGINISPTPVCTGVASVYSSTPGSFVTYTWDFGDGFTAYTPSSTHIYNTPATYLVTLSVVDQLGNTCNASDTISVLPGIGPCSILPAFICPGGTAVLSTPNIAGYTYLWEEETSPNVFVPAPGINTNNTYTVLAPGFFRVIITGVNGCGCTTKKVEVKLMPKPKAIIAVAPSSTICGSGNITLTSVNHLTGYTSDWYANGNYGNLLSSGPVHFEFGDTITTIFNLVLTNEYGCTDTCSFTVTVNPIPVPPVISSSPGLCEGVPITLTVTNYATNVTWNSGSATTSITVTSAGTYTATYTDSLTGCSSNSNITINRRPPVELFPHYCDSIPCTCRNQQGDFTIYAPLPLIGAFAATYDIQWYFNNIPVGTNGPNPIFTPAVTGTYHVVITDPITGCTDTSKTYSIVVPLCNQCDSTTCHVDLGNDTTICAGSTVTLTASGCTGTVTWYELTMNGPVPVGNGPFIDVFPTQTTCYVVKCCDSIPDEINEGFFLCCCYDTICINVNPLPVVSWPVMFPPVCLNSAPVYLDTLLIFASPPGGTGVFSGVNVIGNYFYPNNLGTYTITYCYTDTNGCTTCVSNVINVIFCCDSTSCHVDLGNDTTICSGGVVTLTALGCNGTITWYMLGPNGPVVIPGGPIVDVSPTQTTCYIVECCEVIPDEFGGTNVCCCTDTICINVNPTPTVSWPVMFPPVCLNSAPVYLDTLLIFASPPGGTGVFSGVNVIGNYFYPNTLGSYTITYCYTDTNGCTACVSNIINVVFCCDSSSCHVDLGNDTTICSGGVVTLTALGCNGTITWYMLGPNGPVVIPGGPIVDVFPTQTTCYVVKCCEVIPDEFGGTNVCCCTDTICINVNPTPTVSWPVMYPPVCLNSAPVYLDTLLIFASPPGGTGIFSGVNVIGNYFYPNTLGSYTITYCYTDTNGCTACVSNFITVVFCCDSTTCHVDLGNDTSICAGGVLILSAQGCNGNATWYMMDPVGGPPMPIGQGPFIDVFPQVNTCYIVECCDTIPDPINGGFNICCCTDTICINVNPTPTVSWPVMYPPVCLNSAPVYLDTLLIFASPPGGTGIFSGVNVIGNYFYPNTLGSYTITYCYTDTNGCTACVSNFITVVFCCDSTTCHVDLGNDTSICAGGVLILSAQGCNGNATWYMMDPVGGPPMPIGQGPFIDVFPQVNTCYIVECCDTIPDPINGGFNICCCTDTICINVNPTPTVSWPVMYPPVCLNSAPVYLDTLLIFASPPGGIGVFSGVNVIGNYFYPNNLGTYTITYCYTDTNGCTACVSNFINVIFCCDSTSCHVDLGNDTSICAGGVLILSAQGCNGNAIWYMMDPVGGPPMPIGQGPFIDVFPQVNTCYIVECCDTIPDPINGGFNICCCTDTICINVNPTPTVSWPVMFPPVCLNSAPVYLDTLLIFASPPGGTGVFSGVNVVGNYFYPNTLGSYTITYCYTDTNGCIACVSNFINVIFCCDSTSCHVDLGNDTSICAGGVLILSAQGCNGNAIWYMMDPVGGPPMPIGQGPFIDVFPQVSTCYIVECCDTIPDPINGGFNICCCTDTICINVNRPPTVSWNAMYPSVCLNSAPVYLDTLNIFTFPPGGTGVFSGVNVIGNYFYPNNLGTFTITYCYTDTNGCTACVSNIINVVFCCDSSSCHVDLGNDTSICLGGVIILTANGCNGNATWYQLTGEGPVPIGQGPILDVFPQVSTCYIVECCDTIFDPINGYTVCCCTDTICITVNPTPSVSWPVMFPPVCLNSAPVYLDTLNIFATPPGGTGVFSGVGVIGNYFYPNTLGAYTITYCYVDLAGCTTCVSNTINVIFCCDSSSCHVDLGNDTSICSGGVIILTANGCNGNATWYQLTGEGAIPIGQGPILDVFPQVSTCYIVECCDTIFDPINGFTVCCCSDTICININSPSTVSWNVTYPSVCLNSAPVYLDTLNIFTFPPGGTGTFTGVNVIGNYFYPNALGTYTITYCYVNLAGCTTCVSKTITVINCCENSCQINAGPDQSICKGVVAILNVTGCDSIPKWYKLTMEGPVLIGQGPILDVVPQQTTCYIVICCCPETNCCDTDTVCVTVKPLPTISWPISFADVCINTAPVFLNPLSIIVNPTGGTGVFSGPGVFGNFFYPNTLGTHFITYTYTAPNGCTVSISKMIKVKKCNVKLDIKIYLEGFYLGFGLMQPVLHNIGMSSDPTVCDSITVELHESIAPYSLVETATGILHTDGLAEIEFPDGILTKSYYIVVRHRNSTETWSKNPVLFNTDPTGFDFTVH